MSFTFPVTPENEINMVQVASDAWMQKVRRDDMVRRIWGECILPKIFRDNFIKNLVNGEARTTVFSFDVPMDQTIKWSDQRHIAMLQNFAAVAGNHVRCVPWQIRVEFAHAVRPYIFMKRPLIEEVDTYIKPFGWKFTTTDEGFLLIPLNMYKELEETHDMYEKYWSLCKTVRGPSVTDLDWGDNDFKTLVDTDALLSLSRSRPLPSTPPEMQLPAHFGGSNASAAIGGAGGGLAV